MRFAGLIPLAALLALPAGAAAQAPPRPVVYVIVVDGLDGDKVDAGGAPFVSSLLEGKEGAAATYYRESRSTMVAETNPNHTSMATGAYGGSSGVPGNAFAVYGDPPNEDGCPASADESKKPVTTSGEDPSCVAAETLFQALDRQDGAGVSTAGIFGKPKLGRLFAAKRPDGKYYADHLWVPCEDPGDDTPYCKQVAINPATRYAADDSIVMDEVIRSAREDKPDYTFVNLPQVDSAGHATGTGPAYDQAIAMADAQIRRFVEAQRELGQWGTRTVLLLVSDHSMDTTPDKTSLDQRFRAAGIPSDSYTIVQNGSASLVYLANRRDAGRFELLKRMREAAIGPGTPASQITGNGTVSEALYREENPADGGAAHTLQTVHPNWFLEGPRTGDLVVTANPGSAFSDPANPLTGNHGGPQTRDNFMALIGPPAIVQQKQRAGTALPGFDDTAQNPDQSENVDVAPTVARLLGLRAPRDSQGRVLGEALLSSGLPPVRGGDSTRDKLKLTIKPKRVRADRRVRFTFKVTAGDDPVEAARISFGGRKLRTNSRGRARATIRFTKRGLKRGRVGATQLRKGSARVRVLRR